MKQKKAYIIFDKDSEGQPYPIAVALDKEAAELYIRTRVAALNSIGIREVDTIEGLINRHNFNPHIKRSHTIEEINLVKPNGEPLPVWYVKIDYDRDKTFILRYAKEVNHVTYFPLGVGDIPISTHKFPYSRGNVTFVFSKASLEDAFQKAEAYLKGLEREYSYKDSYYP